MSDFLSFDSDVDPNAGSSFTLHPDGAIVDFKVVKFEKSKVQNPSSAYNNAFMAKLELDAQGAKVFENIILHTKFEWKIAGLFKSLGLMDRPANERWNSVLGACGQIKVKVSTYQKDGEDRKKNEVDQYQEFNPQHQNSFLMPSASSVPPAPNGAIPPNPSEGPLPWE